MVPHTSLSALGAVSIGLVLVAIDFRTEALDLVPDPVGWLLVAYGMYRLSANVAAVLAVLAAVTSLSDAYLGFYYVLLHPSTLEVVDVCPLELSCPYELRYHHVGIARASAIGATAVLGGTAIALLAHRLANHPMVGQLPFLRRRFQLLAYLVILAWAAPLVAVVVADVSADGRYQPFWDGGLAFVSPVLAGVLLVAAFVMWRASSTLGWTLDRSVSLKDAELPAGT